ncbi:TetR/AcrR family transcriptional regulator [Alteromonas sp. 1_MG-2023]|uniref:TetR/AcrR family transcriptional regulator n=1 Tax=Alteromonas sp. 1_MG-2023 TaxID=3062669 RepID=UPI0026E3100B|nr:TetR/AcrR family transcriptional regulator [Alteromonas sp. 1_MG-2023]MDO6475280.1 TetR/AcrR family transcriptional regulator [Alteromonas sp. 1_MG-2023]
MSDTPSNAAGYLNLPKQERSRASLQRIYASTKSFMLERGNFDFTLIEVSKHAETSTGTIYQRFENKDNLVKAVIIRMLNELHLEEQAILNILSETNSDLSGFLTHFVAAYESFLRKNVAIMRLCILKAEDDAEVLDIAKSNFRDSEQRSESIIRRLAQTENLHISSEQSNVCFHIVFDSLARQLGVGSPLKAGSSQILALLIKELPVVCMNYLRGANSKC